MWTSTCSQTRSPTWAPHPQFTLFASQDDKALAFSRWIWGSDARLGAIDPKVEPYKSQLAAEHVNVFDLSDIKSGDAANHNKFVNSPEVVQLIGNRLATGQSLSDSHESVADQVLGAAANGVGALEASVERAERLLSKLLRNNARDASVAKRRGAQDTISASKAQACGRPSLSRRPRSWRGPFRSDRDLSRLALEPGPRQVGLDWRS